MSTKEKLIKRFLALPKDFTFEELVKLFNGFGFEIDTKGKTSGSRYAFQKEEKVYVVHKPHPSNVIKEYVMKQVRQFLTKNNFIKTNEN
jgi:hypothetical protein